MVNRHKIKLDGKISRLEKERQMLINRKEKVIDLLTVNVSEGTKKEMDLYDVTEADVNAFVSQLNERILELSKKIESYRIARLKRVFTWVTYH